jgi:hypothetical protein
LACTRCSQSGSCSSFRGWRPVPHWRTFWLGSVAARSLAALRSSSARSWMAARRTSCRLDWSASSRISRAAATGRSSIASSTPRRMAPPSGPPSDLARTRSCPQLVGARRTRRAAAQRRAPAGMARATSVRPSSSSSSSISAPPPVSSSLSCTTLGPLNQSLGRSQYRFWPGGDECLCEQVEILFGEDPGVGDGPHQRLACRNPPWVGDQQHGGCRRTLGVVSVNPGEVVQGIVGSRS